MTPTRSFGKITPAIAGFFSAALITGIFISDMLLPNAVMTPIFYVVVLVLAAWTRRRWAVWTAVAASIVLTAAGAYFGPHGAIAGEALRIQWANRSMIIAACVLTGIIADLWIGNEREVEQQREALAEQNQQLETGNREIVTREEEITRQNEELQAQTEELERQSEELRVSNEELGRREKMLERLLDLARSLTAETTYLSKDEILSRICESLTELTQGTASTVMMQEDGYLRVHCHHGFGAQGILNQTIPMDESFASLIISRLQSGFVEDMDTRPDLKIPQPALGDRLRSVLSSPLQIGGKLIGVVEIYSNQPRSWSPEQVALIESLAAQTSISLSAAQLFETAQRERRRFETVVQTLPLAICVADDPLGKVIRVNPAAAAMFNVSVGANISPFSSETQRTRLQFFKNTRAVADQDTPLLRAVMHGESTTAEELDVLFSNNIRKSLLISSAPIDDGHGTIVGGVMAAVDVTLMKNLQRELDGRRREAEEASLRKTRFLAAISHDIRTPVNAISLTANLLTRASRSPAMATEIPNIVGELRNNTEALNILVHDLLDVARFDTGKVEFQETEFSLAALIADETRQILPLANEKGLQLLVDPVDQPIWLRADKVKLARVLANLLGNAIKFTEHGVVRIRATLEDTQSVIQVIDTGIGIAADQQAHIFDEFTQLRNPERDRYKGAGLGLAICRRLIEAMGGSIAVESQEGRGSTFSVRLPGSALLVRAASLPPKPPALPDRTLAGMSVLLVEDHATTRWATSQILRAEGATVFEAHDATAGLKMLRERTVDVLLLDMMLPDMDGRDVLKIIKTEEIKTMKEILVLTGDATLERTADVKALGAAELVSKPINIPNLLTTLGAMYERLQRTRGQAENAGETPPK